MLWNGEAPYEGLSRHKTQPSLKAYEVKDADIAVIVCPGGAYRFLTNGLRIKDTLRQEGFSVFLLRYRVAPCDPNAPLADAQRAIRLVRSLGYDHVGVMGFSSGGHLAGCAAVHWDRGDPDAEDPVERLSCRPDFLVACYAVVNFSYFPDQSSVVNLLGDRADDPELLRYFSVDENVTADTPPAFIWHSITDRQVSVKHSLMLAMAYDDANVPFDLRIYSTGRHGAVIGKRIATALDWPEECVTFIRQTCAKAQTGADDNAGRKRDGNRT